MKKVFYGILVGLALGLPGGWYALDGLGPQLGFDGTVVTAEVVSEVQEDERVVLMLRDGTETFFAAFRERHTDVAALVEPGDTISLFLQGDSPIIDDAPIRSVVRSQTNYRRQRRLRSAA